MRKLFTFIIAAAGMLGVSAQDFQSGELNYSVLSSEEKTCAVTGLAVDRSSLETLTIPSTVSYEGIDYTVTEIGDWAFNSMYFLVDLTLPETLREIGGYAFWNAGNLSSIVIPAGVTVIKESAFSLCPNLRFVELGKSVTTVYGNAFRDTPLLAVNIKADNPFEFGSDYGNTYEYCFPTNPLIGVPANSVDAYRKKWPTARVCEYKAVDYLYFEQYQYEAYPGESVKLDYSVDPSDSPVSFYCDEDGISISDDGLVTVDHRQNETNVTISAGTLNGLVAYCRLTVKPLPRFQDNGLEYVVYQGEEKEVGFVGGNDLPANLTIPETVEYNGDTYTVAYICDNAICGSAVLEELTIPATVKAIGSHSFWDCFNLQKVTIADSDQPLEMPAQIFGWANNLQKFYLGRNITGAGLSASIWGIYWVILGPDVTEVPAGAFLGSAYGVRLVESYNPEPPRISGDCFNYDRTQIKVVVPEEYLEAYRNAWGQLFGSIVPLMEVTEIAFEKDEAEIYTGENLRLPLIVEPKDAPISWSSSDTNIVRVDGDGNIKVNNWDSFGDVVITATALNGLSADCRVSARRWFNFSENSIVMNTGESINLEIEKSDRFTSLGIPLDLKIAYGSDVVALDSGKLIGLAPGHASVCASADIDEIDCDIYQYLSVNVVGVPISVTMSRDEIKLPKGSSESIGLIFEPDYNVNRTVTWTVENPEIAEVFEQWGYYYVRGLEAGTTAIHGETVNGLKVDFKVNVTAEIEELTFNTRNIVLLQDETFQLEYTTLPVYTGQTIVFRSMDESVATVDPESGLVTGVGIGNTNIYAEEENGRRWYVRTQVCTMPESVKLVGSTDYEGELNYWRAFDIAFTPDSYDVCKRINWTLDDPEIAEISESNRFKGRRFGTTAFKGVAANGDVLEGTITISGLQALVDGVAVDRKEVNVGDVFRIGVNASSEDLLANLTFSSSDPDVATVSEDGTVTAVGCGNAYIRAQTWIGANENEGKWYATDIYVTVRPLSGIAFDATKVIVTPNAGIYLSIIRAQDVEIDEITWECSNEDVVAVNWSSSTNAGISYVSPGHATVTATDSNGNTATCEVGSYCLQITPTEVEMPANTTFQLQATLLPEGEATEPIYWSSYDDGIISVDENGLLTSNDVIGKTTVRANITIGRYSISADCTVTVGDYVPVTEIVLNETYISAVEGSEVQLIATVYPEEASNKQLCWRSGNERVATVDQNGLVKILSAGNSVISVQALDGSWVSAICEVVGISGVEGILEEGTTFDIYDLNGIIVRKDATEEDLKQLDHGIYLVRKGDKVIKLKR